MRLLAGNSQELLQIISILLGSNKENVVEGNFIPMAIVCDILNLMKETAYSHLMEVSNLLMGCAYMLGNSIFRCFHVRLLSPNPFSSSLYLTPTLLSFFHILVFLFLFFFGCSRGWFGGNVLRGHAMMWELIGDFR